VPDECVKTVHGHGVWAYVFLVRHRAVAITWCAEGTPKRLELPRTVQAYDIMGNKLSDSDVLLGQSPVYLLRESVANVVGSLPQ
jgi:hypothetical protein